MKPRFENENFETIQCPVCGREFLPAEIYIGKYFMGMPTDIERDSSGHIMTFCGKSLDPKETYLCDCGTHFNVEAIVTFKTSIDQQKQFSSTYKCSLFEDRITLPED